jgi:hypothetical protein
MYVPTARGTHFKKSRHNTVQYVVYTANCLPVSSGESAQPPISPALLKFGPAFFSPAFYLHSPISTQPPFSLVTLKPSHLSAQPAISPAFFKSGPQSAQPNIFAATFQPGYFEAQPAISPATYKPSHLSAQTPNNLSTQPPLIPAIYRLSRLSNKTYQTTPVSPAAC